MRRAPLRSDGDPRRASRRARARHEAAGLVFGGLLTAGLAAPPQGRAALPQGFYDETMIVGLDQPVGMAFLPDGRLLVIEQTTARVRLVVGGQLGATDPVLTVPDVQTVGPEQGLLGIAVDPGWPARPYVYFQYDHVPDNKIRISRYTFSGDLNDPTGGSLLGDPASRHDLLTDIPDQFLNHNGGTLRFGPDGMLYASAGEDAVPCAAQDTASLRGVILRLDVSNLPPGPGGPPPKSQITPPDNPFAGPNDNARLTYAIGLRNPFRFHIDPPTGHLFIADVGQSSYEEVDWATAGGMNFGWPFREGPAAGPVASCPGITNSAFAEPIAYYDRTGFGTAAAVVSGGVYRSPCDTCPEAFPAEYEGDYFYADYYNGFFRRIRYSGGVWAPAPPANGQPNPSDWAAGIPTAADFAVGPEGALYYVRQFDFTYQPGTGSLRRIVHPAFAADVSRATSGRVKGVEIEPARPNPALGAATLVFHLTRSARVDAVVRDLQGRRVRDLLRGAALPAGRHSAAWDGEDGRGRLAPAGVYAIEVDAGGQRAAGRLVLLR